MTESRVDDFRAVALRAADVVLQHRVRLVLVESCTAGLVAASLGQVPGISECLCGSFVVYRKNSKTEWLGIDAKLLDDPKVGPVSAKVTRLLADAALIQTPEAALAIAITGHLGPDAPAELDGKVFISVASRDSLLANKCSEHMLKAPRPKDDRDLANRIARQQEATQLVLQAIIEKA